MTYWVKCCRTILHQRIPLKGSRALHLNGPPSRYRGWNTYRWSFLEYNFKKRLPICNLIILFSCQIVVTKKNSTTGFLIRISAMIWQENPVLGKLKEYIRHLLCAYFYLFFRLNNVIKDWKTNKLSTYKYILSLCNEKVRNKFDKCHCFL